MSRFTTTFLSQTPRPVKLLLAFTIGASLLVACAQTLLPQLSATRLGGLSLDGIARGYAWQPFTYLLIAPGSWQLSIQFAFSLLFDCILLWVVGAALTAEIGAAAFFRLYFTCGAAGGLLGLGAAAGLHSPEIVIGPAGALYACLLVWNMMFANLELRLFLFFSARAKWVITGLFCLSFIEDLAEGRLIAAAVLCGSLLAGYIYGVCAFGLKSPYEWTHRFDAQLHRLVATLFKHKQGSKIVDIRTGRAYQNDADFLRTLEEKVLREGQQSLTWKERWRKRRIFKRRQS